MTPMWEALGVLTTKVPISYATFGSHILPFQLFCFAMAVLVITPQTRTLRAACWPVLLLLAWRATYLVDMTPLNTEEDQVNLAFPIFFIVIRALYWAVVPGPLVRRLRPMNSTPSTLMDVIHLFCTFRGLGWDWSGKLYIPPDNRPSNRIGFLSSVFLSCVVHAFIFSMSYHAVKSFSPVGLGSIVGGSIFDETLPSSLRYLRSSIITIIVAISAYSFLQTQYDLGTLLDVLLIGQDPTQWPPSFDAPWRATSLIDFWGRRWHQWFRHLFLVLGGYPLAFILGRAGLVIGAFLASGVFHYIMLHSLDHTCRLSQIVGFGMMAPGILFERAFERWTGRKVGGLVGWIWTMTWLVLWGNLMVDGFVRAALFRSGAWVPDVAPPVRMWVESLVMGLDTWLHAM